MKKIIFRLKGELKVLAQTITDNKKKFKDEQRQGSVDRWKTDLALCQAQYQYRHKHIVRCLLRGRTMSQIENVDRTIEPYCHNKPSQQYIDTLMKEYQDEANGCNQIRPIEIPTSSPSGSCGGGLVPSQPVVVVPVEPNTSLLEIPQSPAPRKFMEIFERCWEDLLA